MKKVGEDYLGTTITSAVRAVPAHFSNNHLKATKDAGESAGLSVTRVPNAPPAAAIASAFDKEENQKILVLLLVRVDARLAVVVTNKRLRFRYIYRGRGRETAAP